jgi:tetrathionate reductase subunit B
MEKCNLCAGRIAAGLEPACVEACVYGARVFGDINDPDSDITALIARKHGQALLAEEGTEPAVHYASR